MVFFRYNPSIFEGERKQAGKKGGGWREFRFSLAKSNCGQPATAALQQS